jgi:DNA segregation ATPase FtsK/SpoIIIE, S-DNA-T family
VELRLTIEQDGSGPRDVVAELDGDAPVHALLEALGVEAGLQGRMVAAGTVLRTGELVHGATPVGRCDLRDGDVVRLETTAPDDSTAAHDHPGLDDDDDDSAVAELVVVGGPLMGTRVALARGAHVVGRGPGADVVIPDASLSRRHVRVAVDDGSVEVADLGSSNGTFLEGVAVSSPRALVVGDTLEIGRTLITFEPPAQRGNGHPPARGGIVAFNRPPRVVRAADAPQVTIPAPPGGRQAGGMPLGAALIPFALAVLLYAVTRSPVTLAIGVMTPAMVTYSWWDARRRDRRSHAAASGGFERRLEDALERVRDARADELESRRHAAPAADELRRRATSLDPALWERRPGEADFLELRVGTADLPSAVRAELAAGGDDDTRDAAQDRLDEDATLPAVPVTAQAGGLALVGRRERTAALARWLLVQVAVLHSPAEVSIAAALAGDAEADWDWLKWLPHAGAAALAVGPDAGAALLEQLAPSPGRETVLLIDGAAGIDRARVAGAYQPGVHVIWIGADRREAPGAAGAVVACDADVARLAVTRVHTGETIEDVTSDGVGVEWAAEVARALAGVRDAGAPDALAAVPTRASLLDVLDLPDPTAHALAGLWQARGEDLSAPIGAGADGPFTVDPARTDGLRALIGGMPGAGKSELLQSLVAALATRHPPDRLAFLLVDYKGGAAFKDCVGLPHCAGLVTDLDAHLAERARVSLLAELRRREALLADAGARNLAELTRRAAAAAPPALLVVVDEFATLVREVPAFVDTMIDVAQRGRSLGLHLVLATQRPRGAVSDTIRANTNLRIAMRMADGGESHDIIEAPDAAEIPAGIPGRALALTGRKPGGAPDLTEFQTAYAGGRSNGLGEIEVRVAPFQLGVAHARARVLSMAGTSGPSDLHVLVEAAQLAAERLEIPRPSPPWLAPLPERIELADLDASNEPDQAVIGLLDEPARQRQETATFDLERAGSLLVYGGSGSGKTTLLRTLAVALAGRSSPAETQIYALDFASRGLGALEALPQVGSVIGGDDLERVLRLLGGVGDAMAQRRELLAQHGAATVRELRGRHGDPVPRIVVLLDGYARFAAALERVSFGEPLHALQRIAADGRPLGVHLVATAGRRADVPGALAGVIGARIVLRMTDEDDYAALGVPRTAFAGANLPPGRAFMHDGLELQVATVADLEAEASRIAARFPGLRAPRIRALAARVAADRLPAPPAPLVAVAGVSGESLQPVLVDLRDDHVLVAGPPRSGRSTALAAVVASLRRGTPDLACHLLAPRRTAMPTAEGWASVALGADACREAADRLAALADRPADAPPVLVVVDDGAEIGDLAGLDVLQRRGRDAGVRLLAATETHAAHRAFGGWLRDLRNARRGLLLMPDPETDGDLLGVRLPRTSSAPRAVGRGYAVADGVAELVQVALP